jgi:hypothetical protein
VDQPDDIERRAALRYPLALAAELSVGALTVEGEIYDLSQGGAQFVSGLALQVGEIAQLHRPEPLASPVRVARATRQPDGRTVLGLRFEGESPFTAFIRAEAERQGAEPGDAERQDAARQDAARQDAEER